MFDKHNLNNGKEKGINDAPIKYAVVCADEWLYLWHLCAAVLYKESALIPVPMESWRGYETVECTTLIFLEVSEYLPEMTRRFESPRIYEIDFQTDLLYSSPTQPCVWKKQRSFA